MLPYKWGQTPFFALFSEKWQSVPESVLVANLFVWGQTPFFALFSEKWQSVPESVLAAGAMSPNLFLQPGPCPRISQ